MSKPFLEEVDDDDIDNMEMDLAQFDPTLKTPVAPLNKPVITRSQDSEPNPFMGQSINQPKPQPQQDLVDPEKFSEEERNEIRKMQVIYPCYFDINRSHKQGRRVSKDMAVANPLAKTIGDACRSLSLPVLYEVDKCHPQDYGNSGRVRVMLKENGQMTSAMFTSKRLLFRAISKYLQAHPTTVDSIRKQKGMPFPAEYEQNFEPEELPKVKGFKMNSIVPVHSSLTLKHPMTKSIYDPEPEAPEAPKLPKAPKKKVMKIRG